MAYSRCISALMKRFVLALVLGALSMSSNATTYLITGGNWDNSQEWSTEADGNTHTTYDNGVVSPPAVFGGAEDIVFRIPLLPATMTGTYSGTLITDDFNIVIGGMLNVTGNIGYEFQVANNSWWYSEYVNLTIDFNTNIASVSTFNCYETIVAVVTCATLIENSEPQPGVYWDPIAGNEGIAGAARAAATFDGTTLEIFHEDFAGSSSTVDFLNTLTLEAQVVPIPAAAWLFGSALGLLGWLRRKSA